MREGILPEACFEAALRMTAGALRDQLDAIALGVHDPTELSELGFLGFFIDGVPEVSELLEHCMEVVDAVVDHELSCAGVEV